MTQLVANAVKHAPGAGVELGAQLDGRGTEQRLTFWVADDGPGVPVADAPHVFERSRRGSASRSGGAGLGLAIVAAIAEAYGGLARLAHGGGGARFEVILPLRTPLSQVSPHVSAT